MKVHLITEKEAEHLYQKMKQGIELTDAEIKEVILVMVYELTEFIFKNKDDKDDNSTSIEKFEKLYETTTKAGTHPSRWYSAAQINIKNLFRVHPFTKMLVPLSMYGVFPVPPLKKFD